MITKAELLLKNEILEADMKALKKDLKAYELIASAFNEITEQNKKFTGITIEQIIKIIEDSDLYASAENYCIQTFNSPAEFQKKEVQQLAEDIVKLIKG